MSVASAKLQPFERIAIDKFRAVHYPTYKEEPTKKYFNDLEVDGVLVGPNGDLVLIEVALGGSGVYLKAGPKRKMLTDAFKLVSASHFLKVPCSISRKALIVKEATIRTKITNGWSGRALSHNQIEVFTADFDPSDSSAVGSIIKECVEEMVEDPKDE